MEQVEELFSLVESAEDALNRALSIVENPKYRELRDALAETYSLRRALEETLVVKRASRRLLSK